MKLHNSPRVALVHYWLFNIRGGEQVIGNIGRAIRLQKIYALFGHSQVARHLFRNNSVTFSILNRLPGMDKYYRSLLPLLWQPGHSGSMNTTYLFPVNPDRPRRFVRQKTLFIFVTVILPCVISGVTTNNI
jgi:hypothetical protein